jgi:hypothetical protein
LWQNLQFSQWPPIRKNHSLIYISTYHWTILRRGTNLFGLLLQVFPALLSLHPLALNLHLFDGGLVLFDLDHLLLLTGELLLLGQGQGFLHTRGYKAQANVTKTTLISIFGGGEGGIRLRENFLKVRSSDTDPALVV